MPSSQPSLAEVVEGRHADGLPCGLDDERLDAAVLPAGQVVAAGGREGDRDRGAPVPGGELGVAVPGVGSLHVGLARRPEDDGFPSQDLDLFGVYGCSFLAKNRMLHPSHARSIVRRARAILVRIAPVQATGSVCERNGRGVLRGLREKNSGRDLGGRPHGQGGEGPARDRRDATSGGHEPARPHLRAPSRGPGTRAWTTPSAPTTSRA